MKRSALFPLLLLSLPALAAGPAPQGSPVDTKAPPSSGVLPRDPTSGREGGLARADAAAKELGKTLRGRLETVLKEAGPLAAVRVCAEEAPLLRAQVEARTGVKVGRASLRTRGPGNASPPAWVGALLVEAGDRTVPRPHRSVEGAEARVALPIVIEAQCLVCHGAPAAIPADVAAALDARYPQDRARGYEVGQLRGLLWAVAPIEPE